MVLVLRQLGQEGDSLLEETLEEDPLDALALWVARNEAPDDLQTMIATITTCPSIIAATAVTAAG